MSLNNSEKKLSCPSLALFHPSRLRIVYLPLNLLACWAVVIFKARASGVRPLTSLLLVTIFILGVLAVEALISRYFSPYLAPSILGFLFGAGLNVIIQGILQRFKGINWAFQSPLQFSLGTVLLGFLGSLIFLSRGQKIIEIFLPSIPPENKIQGRPGHRAFFAILGVITFLIAITLCLNLLIIERQFAELGPSNPLRKPLWFGVAAIIFVFALAILTRRNLFHLIKILIPGLVAGLIWASIFRDLFSGVYLVSARFPISTEVLEVVLLINFIFLAVAWLNVGFAQCVYLRNVKRNFKCGGLTLLVSPLVLLFIVISIPSEFHLNPTKFQITSPFLPSPEQPKALKSQFQTPPTLEELNALKSIRGKIPGSIVWATSRHGTWEIYRMKADGTEKIRLTNDPHLNTHPLWSRDGRWIYFERDSDIYRMLPDGSNSHLIVQNGFSFALSHDDSKLVYVREEQGGCSILLFDLKKKKEEEIIPGRFPQFKGKQLRFPSLSPDGRQLAFSSDYPTPWTIHLVKPDGSEIFQFDNGCMPDYSPDGLMVTWVTGGYHEIYIGTPHGKTKQLFEGSIPGRPHCYFPRWSNDGQYIVFAASPSPDRGVSDYEIYIKPTRGGKAVRLTFHPATDTWPSLFIPHK